MATARPAATAFDFLLQVPATCTLIPNIEQAMHQMQQFLFLAAALARASC